jgi:hypothetical protein
MSLQNLLKEINETKDPIIQEQLIYQFLYKFLEGDEFWVVAKWTDDLEQARPFIGMHKGQIPCYYVFTDAEIAANFAKHYGLSNDEGKTLVIKQNPEHFAGQLMQLFESGVEMVMFDEGANLFAHTIPYILDVIAEYEEDED